MRERNWIPSAKSVCACGLVFGGVALIATSLSVFGGPSLADAAGPIVVGVALIGIGVLLVGSAVRQRFDTWLEVRRGLRQIEMVLRLEAALSARRVPATGPLPGCPRCGAPAGPDGPSCHCPRQ